VRDVLIGVCGIVAGTLLKPYGDEADPPAIELGKLGVVLVAVGVLDPFRGFFRMPRRPRRRT
jgi:hypothetical protein